MICEGDKNTEEGSTSASPQDEKCKAHEDDEEERVGAGESEGESLVESKLSCRDTRHQGSIVTSQLISDLFLSASCGTQRQL